MRKFLIACSLGAVATFGLFSCGQHFFDDQDPEARMVQALQEALVLGSRTAADNLGNSSCTASLQAVKGCTTGYLGNALVEILVPDTVKNVLKGIKSFTNNVDKVISNLSPETQYALNAALNKTSYNAVSKLSEYGDSIRFALNRGAEQAAPKSIDVFKDAILGMSFSDARGVLLGDGSAATTYLHTTTYSGLQSAFAPIIGGFLQKLNLDEFWGLIARNYNSFLSQYSNIRSISSALPEPAYSKGLPENLSKDLSEYATGKALDGLFTMVGKQETQLRADPWGTVKALGGYLTDTVSELLGDVFSKAKNGSL